jgi:hypothetical protein|tara:strand:- start:438 stop:2510 length:2073 start_codon:yes stop_codon:yes gene_type:complete
MIKLEVIQDTTGQVIELDLFGNENINITLQVDDVRDIESKNASYSKDFNIPATKRNNKFFEHYYNLDRYTLNFSPYRIVKAFLYSEDVLVLEGYLRLLNVVDKDTEITYNVVLFNDVANIIETLADKTIKDLDFTDIIHEFTVNNILNSWTDTGVTLTAGGTSNDVFYPIINDGQMTILDIEANNIGLFNRHKNYVLNLRLKYVIDKIFDLAGFSYDSNFFDSSYFSKIYFDTGIESTELDAVGDTLTCDGVPPVGAQALSLGGNTSVSWTNESGDVNNAFNVGTGTFTAPFDTMANFVMTIAIQPLVFPAIGTVDLVGLYTPSGGAQEIVYLDSAFVYIQGNDAVTFNCNFDMGVNDTMSFQIHAEYNGLFAIPDGSSASLSITTNPQQPTLQVINSDIGEIKLADILTDVFKIFNLTLESVQNNVLKIETYDNYLTETTLDWTKKININEIVIEPIEIPKRIEFHHAQDSSDYYKNKYENIQGTPFGSHIVEFDVDNDKVIQIQNNVFAAPYVNLLEGGTNYTQVIAEQDGETFKGYKNLPRLVFKRTFVNENDFIDFGYFDTSGSLGVFSAIAEHTVNAHFYDESLEDADTSDNSLLYGQINPFDLYTLGNQPTNTLFDKYWFNYINDKYNVTNGLLLKAEIYLKPTDIYNFSFSNKIKIKDQEYRVNKIEYNTDINKLAKVELLRI